MSNSRSHKISSRFQPLRWLLNCVDADYYPEGIDEIRAKPDRVDWRRCAPFIFLHVGCIGVFWVGWSWPALICAALLYFIRMFAVTGFYHRYFAHRTFSASRPMQFAMAVIANLSVQRGALWWAAVHRHHHQHSDDEEDVHSPLTRGFYWAHIGWMTSSRNFPTDYDRVKDLAKFPELVFLNRFDMLAPFCLAVALLGVGAGLHALGFHTTAAQMLVWGFFISTVVLLHATLCINSLAHTFGNRRYETGDTSRNSLLLALITLGEGWHNNHHFCMTAARQGFYWWELDITYYMLKCLSWLGLIHDLRPVPRRAYEAAAEHARARREPVSESSR